MNRDLAERIKLYRSRYEAAPHSRAFAPLADLLRQADRTDEALVLLEEGLARDPDYQTAMVILGRTLLDRGRTEQAREVLLRVLEMDPENIVVLGLLVDEAGSRKAWSDGVPLLERLVRLDPDNERWPATLDEARQMQQSVRVDDQHAEGALATMTLVDIYLAQGYLDRALEALREILRSEPDRKDVQERIRQLERGTVVVPDVQPDRLQELPELLSPGKPAVPASLAGNERTWRRDQQREQFAEWIRRIRDDRSGD